MCGMTTVAGVRAAVDAGADAVGFILAPSPRRVPLAQLSELARSVPPFVRGFAVVVEPTEREVVAARDAALAFQFCGDESAERCEAAADGNAYVKVRHVAAASVSSDANAGDAGAVGVAEALDAFRGATWLFDTKAAGARGGTGTTFDWSEVAELARARDIVVAGGLTAENVGACVRAVRPFAVDVRSGVETDGRHDPIKMRAFVRAVREADAEA